MKQGFKARPCLGKKGLSTEERTKLFWPLVARDFESQALQTRSVSTRENYSPAVSRRSVRGQDGCGVFKGTRNSITCIDQAERHGSPYCPRRSRILSSIGLLRPRRHFRIPVWPGANRPSHGRVPRRVQRRVGTPDV